MKTDRVLPRLNILLFPYSDDDEDTWAAAQPTSDSRFKVLPFEFSPRGKITPKLRIKGRPDPRFDDSAVRLLSPKVINRLGQELGKFYFIFWAQKNLIKS